MTRDLVFNSIAVDMQPLGSGGVINYFQESDLANSQSVTQPDEASIVRWLFSNTSFRALIIREFTGNEVNAVPGLAVMDPIIQDRYKKPGDIDIILCSRERPHQAIAIETKRVKVTLFDEGPQRVNKLDQLGEGIPQANGLQSMGFWKSYLMPIIVVDARKAKGANTLLKYEVQGQARRIYEVSFDSALHPDVGVAYTEIVQPTGRSYDHQVVVGICIDKPACQLEQPAQLTERISTWLSHTNG